MQSLLILETFFLRLKRAWLRPVVLAFAVAAAFPAPGALTNSPAEAPNPEADKAWKEVQKALRPPMPPPELQTPDPNPEDRARFRLLQADLAGLAADKARDFYTKYPSHPQAALARRKRFEMLQTAVRLGNTNRLDELAAATQERLNDPDLTEAERFEIRKEATDRSQQGMNATDRIADLEKSGRAMIKEFPRRPDGYQMLLAVAEESEQDKARAIAEEIIAADVPDKIKEAAKGLLKGLDALGKPLKLQFTALDGRQVDVSKMAGKVILIDFWATWCGPCVGELPNVKRAYEKLHSGGFEIVGISLDGEKEALERFVRNRTIEWPQFFDGQGWDNKFAREFGIHSIPAMWLVDKKGNLRDENARGELEAKIERLLAE